MILQTQGTEAGEIVAELTKISFAYPSERRTSNGLLYQDFTLSISRGSTLVIMGSSGSGKSTLGKLASGVLRPDRGDYHQTASFGRKADVIYVDQHPMNTVFPWQRVRRNIEYPLNCLNWPAKEITNRVEKMLEMFRLQHLANSRPAQMSGGELQRLALARTFAWKPKLSILDESVSALDGNTKQGVINAIHKLAVEDNTTIVLITHNIADAMAIGNRFVVVAGRPVRIVSDFETTARFPRRPDDPECVALQEELLGVIRHGLL